LHEFLVVFRKVQVCDGNTASTVRSGRVWGVGWVRVRRLRVREGADKKFQPAQDYTATGFKRWWTQICTYLGLWGKM